MSREWVERFDHAGFRITIFPDLDYEKDEDGEDLFLITTDNRYFQVERDGFSMDGCRDGEYKKDYHVLRLNAYIHSGVALSLGSGYPFNDPWDSGQIGYVLVKKRAGFRNIKKAAQSLVDEWNSCLSGEVYGYVVEREEDGEWEHVDSCWGFVGDSKYCVEEAKRSAESSKEWDEEQEKKIGEVMAI